MNSDHCRPIASGPAAPLPAVDDQRAGVGADVQPDVVGHVVEIDADRKAALKADPAGGRLDVGQECRLLVAMGDGAHHPLHPAAKQLVGVDVDVDPDRLPLRQMTDRLFLIEGDDPPVVGGDDADPGSPVWRNRRPSATDC